MSLTDTVRDALIDILAGSSFRIRFRRGIATEWITANPILLAGEPGFEIDTGKEKRGDGVSLWTDLRYFGDEFVRKAPTVGAYTYDGSGNILSDPDGVSYTYNSDGTLATETFSGVTRTYHYNSDGSIGSVT